MGARVWGFVIGVVFQGVGCLVELWGAEFGVQVLGCRFWVSGFRAQGFGLGVEIQSSDLRACPHRLYSSAARVCPHRV